MTQGDCECHAKLCRIYKIARSAFCIPILPKIVITNATKGKYPESRAPHLYIPTAAPTNATKGKILQSSAPHPYLPIAITTNAAKGKHKKGRTPH